MHAAPQKCFRRKSFLQFRRAAALFFPLAFGTLEIFAQRPLGVDASRYQGGSINWTSVKNTGVSFAWAKATEGLTVNDADFSINQVNAKNAGVLIGAYHFAHPETHIGIAGADQEAAHFWNIASNYIKIGSVYLMPMLDMETDLSTASPPYTKATLSQWVNEWCNDIVGFAASNGVAVKPVIYTGISYSSTWLNSTVTNWPLWMANWPSNPNPQSGVPSSNSPWPAWSVWQYTDSNAVVSVSQGWDLDVFNGTTNTIGTLVIGGLGAPAFTSLPLLYRVADTGGSASFSATAVGLAPLKYQWTLNGTNLSGATIAALNLTNAQPANSGYYSLIVTNSSGSVTSSPVSLLVYPLQATVFADNFDANTATNW